MNEGQQEIADAMEMMGKGYEPSLEIHPQQTVIKRHKGEMQEEVIPAFVKISTSFKSEIKTMSGMAMKVWIYLALSINRNTEQAHPGIRNIADNCGIAKTTTVEAVKELEKLGLLQVNREDRKYNIYEIPEYVSANTVSKNGTDHKSVSIKSETVSEIPQTVSVKDESVSELLILNQINQKNQINQTTENSQNQKPRTDAIKKGNMMDAILASEANNPPHKYQQVREEFAREFHFNVLPSDGKNRAWGRLERFLFAAKQKDPDTIHWFAEKRKAEGEFSKLPSNTKIYMNPDLLIAVWPPREDKQSSFEKKLEAAGYYD